jgi:hypothetical protein
VIDTSLRGSVILLLALAALRLMRKRSAAEREMVLRCAIIAVLILPLAAPFTPAWHIGVAGAATGGSSAPFVVWLGGVIVMLVRLLTSAISVARQSRGAREVQRIGRVRVRAGNVSTPMTWGLLRPVILLPESARSATAILHHELAHVRRHDALMLVLGELAKALHWFNPLVYVAVLRMRAESERACDDAVVASGIAAEDVATQLVDVARAAPAPALAATATTALEQRVRALLDPRVRRTRPAFAAVAGVVAAMFVAVIAVAAPRLADPSEYAARYGISPQLAASIIDAAAAESVDVDLAFGLVRAESNFRANAVSSGGAIGLTQILPSTARKLDPQVTREQLFAHPTNLRLGFRLLRSQLDRFGIVEALLAYNLGPRRVLELRASGAPLPMDYPNLVLSSIR